MAKNGSETKDVLSVNFPENVPVIAKADVVVVGGGPGGIGAAVAAGREGKSVLLIERDGGLGGMATAGEVYPFMPNFQADGKWLDVGIFTDWLEQIKKYDGAGKNNQYFDHSAARLAAEDLCLQAGVRILYYHTLVDAPTIGGRIQGVVLHSKSGFSAVKGTVYIDSTGDGDLAALAGAQVEFGGEGTEHVQPMTLSFRVRLNPESIPPEMKKVDDCPSADVHKWFGKQWEIMREVYSKAQAEGRIKNPKANIIMFRTIDPYVIHFNTTRILGKKGIDGLELSEAELEGHRQIRELFDLFREKVPVFAGAKLLSIASRIGVRETRRIRGHAYITRKDFQQASKFPDAVARVNYPIDIHSPTGGGIEITTLAKGDWYEIPYRCLVPLGIGNLLMACRAISADHAAHSSLRIMPVVCSLGQAAGTAAAMAIDAKTDPEKIDGVKLNRRLIERGRNLIPAK